MPWAAFFVVGAGTAGVTVDCDNEMRVSSEANPGIRMLWFRSVPDGEQHLQGRPNQPTEMELQVLDLERIPSPVLGKPTPEIGH